MTPEEFEKYYERIEEVYFIYFDSGFFEKDMRKDKVKQILEEFERDVKNENK
jgi:hypothetical protein